MENNVIEWKSIVGESTLEDGGYAGAFMSLARAHLEQAVSDGQLTSSQMGEIYATMIPAAFDKGMQFALQKKMTELQMDELSSNGLKDRELKDAQIAAQYSNSELQKQQLAELELNGTKDRELKDAQIADVKSQQSERESNGLKDRELKTTQITQIEVQKEELIANGIKDREFKDTQMEDLMAKLENELTNSEKERELVTSQINELELNGVKDRLLKDKQASQVDTNILQMNAQISELELNGAKDRELKDIQIESTEVGIEETVANGIKSREYQDVQISEYSLNGAKDREVKEEQLTEMQEKWNIQKDILENQKLDSDKVTAKKEEMLQAELDQKAKILEQIDADIEFNTSKRVIMEATRKDNLRTKATEQYGDFLKSIFVADVVPSKGHFDNLIGLVNTINEGIINSSAMYDIETVDGANTEARPS